jgi:hypothetical protein
MDVDKRVSVCLNTKTPSGCLAATYRAIADPVKVFYRAWMAASGPVSSPGVCRAM